MSIIVSVVWSISGLFMSPIFFSFPICC
jgi:hypothetical protein